MSLIHMNMYFQLFLLELYFNSVLFQTLDSWFSIARVRRHNSFLNLHTNYDKYTGRIKYWNACGFSNNKTLLVSNEYIVVPMLHWYIPEWDVECIHLDCVRPKKEKNWEHRTMFATTYSMLPCFLTVRSGSVLCGGWTLEIIPNMNGAKFIYNKAILVTELFLTEISNDNKVFICILRCKNGNL